MIVSALRGRIRIQDPRLKNSNEANRIEDVLQSLNGISEVRVNPAIGSLLIYYDTSVHSIRALSKHIKKQLKQNGEKINSQFLTSLKNRRYVKYGLLSSLSGSIIFLVLDSETWHYRIGNVFLSFLSLHLYQNRKRLLK